MAHSPIGLGKMDRFVSVNSALEVDLTGQVNAEMINGRRVSGVGGSLDFSEGATHSAGGLRIVALPSARIVERLEQSSSRLPDLPLTSWSPRGAQQDWRA